MHRQSASWKRFVCAALIIKIRAAKSSAAKSSAATHAPWKAGLTVMIYANVDNFQQKT